MAMKQASTSTGILKDQKPFKKEFANFVNGTCQADVPNIAVRLYADEHISEGNKQMIFNTDSPDRANALWTILGKQPVARISELIVSLQSVNCGGNIIDVLKRIKEEATLSREGEVDENRNRLSSNLPLPPVDLSPPQTKTPAPNNENGTEMAAKRAEFQIQPNTNESMNKNNRKHAYNDNCEVLFFITFNPVMLILFSISIWLFLEKSGSQGHPQFWGHNLEVPEKVDQMNLSILDTRSLICGSTALDVYVAEVTERNALHLQKCWETVKFLRIRGNPKPAQLEAVMDLNLNIKFLSLSISLVYDIEGNMNKRTEKLFARFDNFFESVMFSGFLKHKKFESLILKLKNIKNVTIDGPYVCADANSFRNANQTGKFPCSTDKFELETAELSNLKECSGFFEFLKQCFIFTNLYITNTFISSSVGDIINNIHVRKELVTVANYCHRDTHKNFTRLCSKVI